MKKFLELNNLFENLSYSTKIHSMQYSDFTKVYSLSYKPCKTISNLDTISESENYGNSSRKNNSFLELAKLGHSNHQSRNAQNGIYSALFPEYGVYYEASEFIEYSANSEEGEVVEVESENSDVQTDDSDESGDGDDDDPSHNLALNIVINNNYYDKHNKVRKIDRLLFSKHFNLLLILIQITLPFFTSFLVKSFNNINVNILIPAFISELVINILNFIMNNHYYYQSIISG